MEPDSSALSSPNSMPLIPRPPLTLTFAAFFAGLLAMMPTVLGKLYLRSVSRLKTSVIFLPVFALALKWSSPRFYAYFSPSSSATWRLLARSALLATIIMGSFWPSYYLSSLTHSFILVKLSTSVISYTISAPTQSLKLDLPCEFL